MFIDHHWPQLIANDPIDSRWFSLTTLDFRIGPHCFTLPSIDVNGSHVYYQLVHIDYNKCPLITIDRYWFSFDAIVRRIRSARIPLQRICWKLLKIVRFLVTSWTHTWLFSILRWKRHQETGFQSASGGLHSAFPRHCWMRASARHSWVPTI